MLVHKIQRGCLLVFNNGIILQWGARQGADYNEDHITGSITYPQVFSQQVSITVATCQMGLDVIAITSLNKSGFVYVLGDREVSTRTVSSDKFYWLVIGI